MKLTARERVVAVFVAEEFNKHRIAEILNLNVRAVENHINSLKHKIGRPGSSTVAITRYAIEHNMIPLKIKRRVYCDRCHQPYEAFI